MKAYFAKTELSVCEKHQITHTMLEKLQILRYNADKPSKINAKSKNEILCKGEASTMDKSDLKVIDPHMQDTWYTVLRKAYARRSEVINSLEKFPEQQKKCEYMLGLIEESTRLYRNAGGELSTAETDVLKEATARDRHISDYVVLHDGQVEKMDSRSEVLEFLLKNGLCDDKSVVIMFWNEVDETNDTYTIEDIFAPN